MGTAPRARSSLNYCVLAPANSGRRVHATVPPRVDYKLTPLGVSLGESVCGIWIWVGKHMDKVERARRGYDQRMRPQRDRKLIAAA